MRRISNVLKHKFVKEGLACDIGRLAVLVATARDERRAGSGGTGHSRIWECRIDIGVKGGAGHRGYVVLGDGLVRHPDKLAAAMHPNMCLTNFMDVGIGEGE